MSKQFVIKYKNGKEVEVKSHHIHQGKDYIERSKDASILNLDNYFSKNKVDTAFKNKNFGKQ